MLEPVIPELPSLIRVHVELSRFFPMSYPSRKIGRRSANLIVADQSGFTR
jgi:hypothetical protein